MAFFGDLPREKYSVTSTLSVCSLRFSLIYFLGICLFYKENAVVTPIAVTLADDGKNANTGTYTIAKRTGAGTSANKYNGLSLKASNSEKEFNSSIDLFGTTSASYTFKVKDAGNGKAAIDATNGLKLEDMPMGVGVYETTIEVTITDLNGIKTVVNIPIKVQ